MKRFLAVLIFSLLSGFAFVGLASASCVYLPGGKPAGISQYSPQVQRANSQALLHPRARMSARVVYRMLYESWLQLGVSPRVAAARASVNLTQARKESGLRPSIVSSALSQRFSTGIFQMIPSTFERIRVCGFPNNQKNPLSNIMAVVHAQYRGWTSPAILNGSSGWGVIAGVPR